MDSQSILNELKIKKRNTKHIVDLINTRSDKTPNFSLLLGAGCSVTSGIRPATELIDKWKEEIYLDLKDDSTDEYNPEVAEKYLTETQSYWYNNNSEYSSLFEKKYDLPKQRRMFVESEVKKAKPSLGYAYLTRLVKDNYFVSIHRGIP